MSEFVETYEVGAFPHVTDTDNDIWERYGVFSQPTFAFIDDDGTVDVTRIGPGDLGERVEALLAS